jgi:hypothetical protein
MDNGGEGVNFTSKKLSPSPPQPHGVERAPPPNGADDELPPNQGAPPIGDPIEGGVRFKLEDWNDVTFDLNEEWRVDDVLPMCGFALIYGQKRSFKSFVAMHLALMIAKGEPWAGKHVKKGVVVYIAAEGSAGMRKRIAAYTKNHKIARGQFVSHIGRAGTWNAARRSTGAHCRDRRRQPEARPYCNRHGFEGDRRRRRKRDRDGRVHF